MNVRVNGIYARELRVNWYSLKDAFESLPIMVHVLDETSKICYANPIWFKTLGYSEKDIIGQIKGPEILSISSRDYAENEVIPLLKKEGKVQNIHYIYRKKNGELLPTCFNAFVKNDSEGRFLYGIGFSSPISDMVLCRNEILDRQNAHSLAEKKQSAYLDASEDGIVYESQLFQNSVIKKIDQVVHTDTTVLIQGESGTGKELVASRLHNRSGRQKKPLIKVNCSALPASLIESELFGHVKGAFTGAFKDRKGKFELADGGTIFLDEIGELPLELQPKLLRVLQEKEIEKIGEYESKKIDVRVIAATNRNLEQMVNEGLFRQDLYYRLNVFPITIPALRERKEDLIVLSEFFLKKFSKKLNKNYSKIDHHDFKEMKDYSWPGNIRELQNVIERSVLSAEGNSEVLQISENFDLHSFSTFGDNREASPFNLKSTEVDLIIKALTEAKMKVGGRGGAADLLGLKRTTLIAKMKKYGITKNDLNSQ